MTCPNSSTGTGAGTGEGTGSGTDAGSGTGTGSGTGSGTGTGTGTGTGGSSGGGSQPTTNPGSQKPDATSTNGQTSGDPNRWGVGGPNTPFFGGTPTGQNQEKVFGQAPGAKGLLEIPGFNAGTACKGSDEKHCANIAQDSKGFMAALPANSGHQLEGMGSVGKGGVGSGSGGGSPSLGSLLGNMDKPAGFADAEKRAAEEAAGKPGEEASPSAGAPSAEPESKFESMNMEKAVPVMGETAAPGDEEERKVVSLLDSAKAKISARDYQGAIDNLTEAIKLAPKNAQLYVYRSMAYNLSGNYAAAEKDASAAIALDSDNPEAWVNLAWAQMKLGKYKEAFESVTRALRLDPKNAFAYAIRAFVKEKLGDNQGKMDDIKRATALDSRFLPFYQRGLRGLSIYDPNADYSPFFLHKGKPYEHAKGPIWPLYLGLGLLLLSFATIGGVGYYYYETKKKGSVKNFQEFLDSFKQQR